MVSIGINSSGMLMLSLVCCLCRLSSTGQKAGGKSSKQKKNMRHLEQHELQELALLFRESGRDEYHC